ncbi:histidine phosphatase family protein [Roseovarius rhodophyticola]|uniref:Histidine phosphatase family protein n=1 Tax=Roseovarius rhodophyticola TaxID=3080827 RepID=A0ABZ2TFU3_9RHOB|nr:histidine phosphatase family protein [Roseovarius sp. W115]MDV2930313.1 histidine phosphatase family protein [Roseovarius sp. W115]
MAEIILVRHGQANSTATDEESYDRLSDLGREQAKWLGDHLRETNPRFDRVLTGTLSRQVETARAMGYDRPSQDTRLNELSYFALADAALTEHGVPTPQSTADFATHLPLLMDLWMSDQLSDVPERFDSFASRITHLIDEMCNAAGRTLLVTSGGVIGVAMRHALNLDKKGMAKIMLQVTNASLHRLHFVHETLMVGGFNATPHLDTPERAHARTYV